MQPGKHQYSILYSATCHLLPHHLFLPVCLQKDVACIFLDITTCFCHYIQLHHYLPRIKCPFLYPMVLKIKICLVWFWVEIGQDWTQPLSTADDDGLNFLGCNLMHEKAALKQQATIIHHQLALLLGVAEQPFFKVHTYTLSLTQIMPFLRIFLYAEYARLSQ